MNHGVRFAISAIASEIVGGTVVGLAHVRTQMLPLLLSLVMVSPDWNTLQKKAAGRDPEVRHRAMEEIFLHAKKIPLDLCPLAPIICRNTDPSLWAIQRGLWDDIDWCVPQGTVSRQDWLDLRTWLKRRISYEWHSVCYLEDEPDYGPVFEYPHGYKTVLMSYGRVSYTLIFYKINGRYRVIHVSYENN